MIREIKFQEAIHTLVQNPSAWAIAFSNRACGLVNHCVKFEAGKHALLSEGDSIIATQTLYHSKVSNGDRMIVEKLGNIVQVSEWVPKRAGKIELTLQNVTMRNIYTGESCTVLTCLDAFESEISSLSIPQKQALIIYRNKISEDSIKRREMLFDPICNPGMFKHAYCTTAFRAQGGETDDVVLMVRSLEEIKRYKNGNNFLYTSATRARKRLFICEDMRL